ncbi:hypothetical protein LTR84_009360 [Exophiala bonariae]|uniref:Uncharacterized protein n=1 Tax=Exophiala bonariae TaxID=1690606 RepID=A0AAV9MUH0_9EURO|nr:hypothetical protein LTR84_009360 [Exophiala bonariae]
MAPASTMDSRTTTRSAHPSAGRTPHPPATSKREGKPARDSVASSRYLEVIGQSRMDSTRNTSTMRSSDRRPHRGGSTADTISSRAPRTDREHRECEKSTASTIKDGSVLGSDSYDPLTSRNLSRHDRSAGRFDKSKVPVTIYEEDSRAGSAAPRSSRHDTAKPTHYESSKCGHLVPYDASRNNRDEGAMTRRNDKTFSAGFNEAMASPDCSSIRKTHWKEETASGTKYDIVQYSVHMKR